MNDHTLIYLAAAATAAAAFLLWRAHQSVTYSTLRATRRLRRARSLFVAALVIFLLSTMWLLCLICNTLIPSEGGRTSTRLQTSVHLPTDEIAATHRASWRRFVYACESVSLSRILISSIQEIREAD